jgi:hypothetical protein
MSELKIQLLETWQNLVESIVEAGPRVLAGILLVVVAILVAKIVERVLRMLLTHLKFDDLVGKVGLDKTLQHMGLTQLKLHTEIIRIVAVCVLAGGAPVALKKRICSGFFSRCDFVRRGAVHSTLKGRRRIGR